VAPEARPTRSEREFDRLVRAHAGSVAAYARATAADPWTAEDALQETFLRAWRYFDTFDGRGSFEGWLIRICRNCLIDLANRPVPIPQRTLPDRAAPVDQSHEVYDLLERLPVVQREVMALCGLLGYDYEGAATLLDVPVGTVRSRLHRARRALEQMLVEEAEATA
jgi:RNA polymerase sigma-70 factor (ECF subfamily)